MEDIGPRLPAPAVWSEKAGIAMAAPRELSATRWRPPEKEGDAHEPAAGGGGLGLRLAGELLAADRTAAIARLVRQGRPCLANVHFISLFLAFNPLSPTRARVRVPSSLLPPFLPGRHPQSLLSPTPCPPRTQ